MANESSSKKRKRLVKNPESFRQRAVKASTEKPPIGKVKQITKPFGWLFSKIAKPIKKLGSAKVFKPLRKPLRIIGKIILPVYLRNSFKELKLVTWPTLKQSRQLTFAVLVFAIVFGASIATVDWGLGKLFKLILLK